MKSFKFYIAWLAMLALIFTSCSKEEIDSPIQDEEVVQLTFGSILNDFQDQNKQFTPGEVCREDDPAYVMVAITDEGGAYIDDGDADADDLFQVDLKWNTNLGVWETLYSPQLGLPAGNYQLEHFVVYDAGGDVLWVAPQAGGSYGSYVGNALPQPFVLAAGTKPYITVDVLCFISRNEDAYGYVFFDLNPIPVENSYCVFVNYCDDETEREYPAYFNIDVFTDEAMTDEVMLTDDTNVISMAGGLPAGSVLCFALPDLGEGTYYARVTVMNHNDIGYTADAGDYYDFEITQASIEAIAQEEPAYHHIRIGCAEQPSTPPEISSDTNILIYFDSSGSMDATLAPLQEMRNTLLKAALIGIYNNDEALYDEKVQVITNGTERTMDFLNMQGATPAGDVIVLVFQDESVSSYTSSNPAWDSSSPRTPTFENDITTLRGRLNSFPSNYYHGVIFQVDTPGYPGTDNFAELISYVENGTGNYAGAYGLSDRSEFEYVYDVTGGASPAYYQGLITTALQNLGYVL